MLASAMARICIASVQLGDATRLCRGKPLELPVLAWALVFMGSQDPRPDYAL